MRGEARPTVFRASGRECACAALVCLLVTVGCRDTVPRGAPSSASPAPEPPNPVSSAAASASAPVELSVTSDGCWGVAHGTADALLQRAERRCAAGMVRAAGPVELVGPAKLAGGANACHRVALVGAGRLTATLTDSTGFRITSTGDGAVLLPADGPLCAEGDLTLTLTAGGAARFVAWRAIP